MNNLDSLDLDLDLDEFSVEFERPPPPPLPSEFECLICQVAYLFEDMYYVDVCDHLFCRGCMRVHCALQVKEGAIYINCPYPRCPVGLSHLEIMQLLQEEDAEAQTNLVDKLNQMLYESAIRELKDQVLCPAPDCYAPVPRDDQAKWHKCFKCSYLFCHRCMLSHHVGFTCAQWKQVDGQVNSLEDWIKLKGDVLMRCPKCSYLVEKDGGCNNMECEKCKPKTKFCWWCGKLGHDHGHNGPRPNHEVSLAPEVI